MKKRNKRKYGNGASAIVNTAAQGASMGSAIPGVGTAIGAGIGLVGGAIASAKDTELRNQLNREIDNRNNYFSNMNNMSQQVGYVPRKQVMQMKNGIRKIYADGTMGIISPTDEIEIETGEVVVKDGVPIYDATEQSKAGKHSRGGITIPMYKDGTSLLGASVITANKGMGKKWMEAYKNNDKAKMKTIELMMPPDTQTGFYAEGTMGIEGGDPDYDKLVRAYATATGIPNLTDKEFAQWANTLKLVNEGKINPKRAYNFMPSKAVTYIHRGNFNNLLDLSDISNYTNKLDSYNTSSTVRTNSRINNRPNYLDNTKRGTTTGRRKVNTKPVDNPPPVNNRIEPLPNIKSIGLGGQINPNPQLQPIDPFYQGDPKVSRPITPDVSQSGNLPAGVVGGVPDVAYRPEYNDAGDFMGTLRDGGVRVNQNPTLPREAGMGVVPPNEYPDRINPAQSNQQPTMLNPVSVTGQGIDMSIPLQLPVVDPITNMGLQGPAVDYVPTIQSKPMSYNAVEDQGLQGPRPSDITLSDEDVRDVMRGDRLPRERAEKAPISRAERKEIRANANQPSREPTSFIDELLGDVPEGKTNPFSQGLGVAASLAPVAMNLFQGMKPAQRTARSYQRSVPMSYNRNYTNQPDVTYNMQLQNSRRASGGNVGVQQALGRSAARERNRAYTEFNQMEAQRANQINQYNNQLANQDRAANLQLANQYNMIDEQNDAARTGMLNAGMTGLSQFGQRAALQDSQRTATETKNNYTKRQNKINTAGWAMAYPDFYKYLRNRYKQDKQGD